MNSTLLCPKVYMHVCVCSFISISLSMKDPNNGVRHLIVFSYRVA